VLPCSVIGTALRVLPLQVSSGAAFAAFSAREDFVAVFADGDGLGLLTSPTIYAQQYALAWKSGYEYASPINEAMLLYKEVSARLLHTT
jgi:hypothetical protein